MWFNCHLGGFQPAVYELESADDGTTLIVKVREELWPKIVSGLKSETFFRLLEKAHQIPPLILPSSSPWGFGPVFAEEGTVDGVWRSIRCELPQLFQHGPAQCDNPWGQSFGVSASLYLLLQSASWAAYEVALAGDPTQLVEVELLERSLYAEVYCCIAAAFSPQICNWISTQEMNGLCAEITRRMRNAYLHLYSRSEVEPYYCHQLGARATDPPYILFETPGDRCTLYRSEGTNWRNDQGYVLTGHNVFTPFHQLVLLTGVAALATAYRNAQ